ncbi:MAG: Flp pilus assembly protein CpaB [Methylococcaceae bacterium]
MNRRFIIMLGIALLLALFAAWVANVWIQGRGEPVNTVPVVAAAVEIPFGVKLEEAQVKVIAWPGSSAPQGTYSSIEQVVGRVTMNKFYPDEIITEKRISEHGSTLSALIAKDYRAISVRVDDVAGVAGFILPGNKVDILATKTDRTTNQLTTRTLLQNIKVLAVDQEASPEKEKPAIVRAVTLELKPEQAEIIVQAMQEGTIQLTLRNPLDTEIAYKEQSQPQPVEIIPAKKPVRKIIPW